MREDESPFALAVKCKPHPNEKRIEQRAQHLLFLLKDASTSPPCDGMDLYSVAVRDAFFSTPTSTTRLHRVIREVLWANHDVADKILSRALVLRREDTELVDTDRATRMSCQLLWLHGLFCDTTAFEDAASSRAL